MEVRYGDLDPQGHLNNAKYLTFFEQARVQYLTEMGLFTKDQSFMDMGVIVADIHITFEAPVLWGIPINVGVRTVKIGNKSITLEQCLTDRETDKLYASGSVILVAYDYRRHQAIQVPEVWREKATQFEGHSLSGM